MEYVMNDLKPIIAKNIIELRTAAGMTQIELAEKLNYTDKAVSKWERGESVPDVSVLLRIAELFGVTLDYLVHPHERKRTISELATEKVRNRGLITGIGIVLVWLVATALYVSTDIASVPYIYRWLVFVWAVPVSAVVWLMVARSDFSARAGSFIPEISTIMPRIDAMIRGFVTTPLSIFLKLGFPPRKNSSTITDKTFKRGTTIATATEIFPAIHSPQIETQSGTPKITKLLRHIPCTIAPHFALSFSTSETITADSKKAQSITPAA